MSVFHLKRIVSQIVRRLSIAFFKEVDLLERNNKSIEVEQINHMRLLPYVGYSSEFLPNKVKASFKDYEGIYKEQYLYLVKGNCIIDPIFGWSIILPNKLIKQSVYSFNEHVVIPYPSMIHVLKPSTKFIKLEKVVSFRLGWFNYWHFFNDIIGSVLMLMKQGVIKDEVSIVIPHGLTTKSYFTQALDLSEDLKKLNWVAQDENTFVKANSFIYYRPLDNYKSQFDAINELFSPYKFKKQNDDKIFITRRNTSLRSLSNIDEIERLVVLYGYKIIDSGNYSLKEQINIFYNASHVIGIHGAALTNIVFRSPLCLELLEIFPEDNIPPNYCWLSKDYGFKYNAIVGTKEHRGFFYLDINILKEYLIRSTAS